MLQKHIMNQLWAGLLLVMALTLPTQAQNYAVQSTVQVMPPYSVYLSDYATPGNEKLRVVLLQRDLSRPAYQLRLVMAVELNGKIILRTSRTYNPPPINLDPGIPTVISGADLAPYVDSRNLDFIGYSREQYEKTKSLPEGSYRIIFTAYDYRRQDQQVSNEGSGFYFLSKNEPPLINFPVCGSYVVPRTPQQIIFSWLPRNTSSPNSADETEYEFRLYETRPSGRNPNDVVLTGVPVYTTRTNFTQLVYGPAEPMLLDSMVYVWRVQAIDRSGRDAFRNNGFSEVCTFTYGGTIGSSFEVGIVTGLKAIGETPYRGKVTWDAGDFDAYKVYYKKSKGGYEWFNSEVKTPEFKIFDLAPDTEYDVRVHGRKGNVYSPYTPIMSFRTKEEVPMECGDPIQVPGELGKPLLVATAGMSIRASGIEVVITEVAPRPQDGWFKGKGRVAPKIFGGASFAVVFERLYIDENREAKDGRIDFVTRGVKAMADEQLASQKQRELKRKQEANAQAWAGTDFYNQVFTYEDIAISSVTANADGSLLITGSDSKTYTNTAIAAVLTESPGKAVIIQDKNGDQYVVQKDNATGGTNVTKVEGGGLPPVTNIPVTEDEVDLLKKALAEIKNDYPDSKVKSLESIYRSSKATLSDYHDKVRRETVNGPLPSVTALKTDVIVLAAQPITTGSDEFSSVSVAYKQAERAYNLARVSQLFIRDTNTREEYKLIIQGITIKGMPYSAYVATRKAEGATDDILKIEIKEAVLLTIVKILDEKY